MHSYRVLFKAAWTVEARNIIAETYHQLYFQSKNFMKINKTHKFQYNNGGGKAIYHAMKFKFPSFLDGGIWYCSAGLLTSFYSCRILCLTQCLSSWQKANILVYGWQTGNKLQLKLCKFPWEILLNSRSDDFILKDFCMIKKAHMTFRCHFWRLIHQTKSKM